ncbi:hypothetical protein AB0P02_01265 [Streptomyces griseoluteus]|uniref:hypothetical protein n=1 Tax=Streptomyces griseoluteus TaxID=29306 RepID=UPI00344107BD
MARLWTCGFELQSTTAEFGLNSGSIVTGAPSISTAVHRAGTASLRSNPTAATAFVEHQMTSGVVGRTFHRLYLRVDSLPDTATNIYGIGQTGYFPALLRLQPDGTLVLRDGWTETTLTGTSPVLDLGVWHRIELDYTDVSNGGVLASGIAPFKGYLNGTLFADTMCSNITGFSRVRMGVQLAATTDIYIDDVAVNDTTGTAQTGLPGPGSVVHLRPNAAGDANGWTTAVGGTAGAANNFTRVNERPPDDVTSYNQFTSTGTTATDDFNVENSSTVGIGASDTITLVQVGGRVASSTTTAASIVYRIKGQASGTVLESGSVSVANTTWSVHSAVSPRPYQLTAYTNPQSGAAWTPSSLDSMQIGYRVNVSQVTTRRVSNLWALVEFVPASTGSSQALGVATHSNAAQTLARSKARSVGPSSETGAAQALVRRTVQQLGLAVETTGGQPLTRSKRSNAGPATEASGGQPVTRTKRRASGPALESSVGLAVPGRRQRLLGVVGESSTAQAVARTKRAPLSPVTEAAAGQLLGRRKARPVGTSAATEAAQPTGRIKARTAAPAGEASTAGPLGTARARALAPASDTATARPLTPGRTLQPADSTDTARPLNGAKRLVLGPAVGTEMGRQLVPATRLTGAADTTVARPVGRTKTRLLGTAGETDGAQPLGRARRRGLAGAAESTAGQPLPGSKRRALPPGGESWTAGLPTTAKQKLLGLSADTTTASVLAQTGTQPLDPAEETATGRRFAGRKTRFLGLPATGSETALSLTGRRSVDLGRASDSTAASPAGRAKHGALAPAGEDVQARPLVIPDRLLPAGESSAARPLLGGRRRATGPGAESSAAVLVTGTKRQLLGLAAEATTGQVLARSGRLTLGPAHTVSVAQHLGPTTAQSLDIAYEDNRALIGPQIRLTAAAGHDQALALAGARQRPADTLTPGQSAPAVTATAAGPALRAGVRERASAASTSGPSLRATTRGG